MTTETCQQTVMSGYRSYPCGRPAKADGLCGMHLAVKERRTEREAQAAQNRAEVDAARALLNTLGVDARVRLPLPGQDYDGTVTLTLTELARVMGIDPKEVPTP